MTEQELQEYNRLVNEYNSLVNENNRLIEEINFAMENIVVITGNMGIVAREVVADVSYTSKQVSIADESVDDLMRALNDLTEQYRLFKSLSTATKNLTQYNDEYYTKFKFYNELRRITLGYIIGLDSYIISNKTLRSKVEKSYLANTDYWLSYAIMAVMLWASDEREAAQRALNKALTMDACRSAVFFMLINLRFGRNTVASNWYLYYLERVDVNNIGEEWQQLLQAYLSGAMGNDPQLEAEAEKYFQKIFNQAESTSADFARRINERSESFMNSYIHSTEVDFPALKVCCQEYAEMKKLLSEFEKNGVVAKYYDDVYNTEEDAASNNFERIENVLYDLINAYDTKEGVLVRQMKYSEAVIAAKGDEAAAAVKYNNEYGNLNQKKNVADMISGWAFSSDNIATDITVKKFALGYVADYILAGFGRHQDKLKNSIKDSFNVKIGDCNLVCNENNEEACSRTIHEYYTKNRMKLTLKDKQFKLYIFICVIALLLLLFAGILIKTQAFAVLLVLGIVAGVFGGFLVWRRYVDFGNTLNEKSRKALLQLRNVIEEIRHWNKCISEESDKYEDLMNSILRFKR